MMIKSKRNVLAILIVAALAFLTIGFAKQNVKANADEEDGFSATLSSVKYNVSNDGEYTLLAAAITTENMNRIYEVGFYAYDGEEKVALAPVAATSKTTYYTAINDADSKTIFGTETALPMIVWKVATPNAAVSYEAYVKYGYINENDNNNLWSYATEKTVNGAKKAMAFYTVTIDEDGGDAVADLTVLAGTPASALSGVAVTKTGYHYDTWEFEASAGVWQDLPSSATVTENVTVRPKWVANVYTLTFKDGEDTVDTKNSTYNSAIGELPSAPAKLGYTFNGWTIDGNAITAETLYSASTDKVAMANYTLNTVHDNTATFAADFFKTSDADYTLAATAIDAGLDIGDVIAVCYNGNSLDYTTSAGNFVFGNAYIKAMTVGDYVLDVYTATDTYRAKVAIATKAIASVADLNLIGVNDTTRNNYATAYFIVTNDIDGADQANVNALSVWCGDEEHGFRGIFDGRGHVLKNLKLKDGYFFWGLGKATLRDFALIDPVQVTAANYVLASGVHHATITDVIVKADSKFVFGSTFSAAEISNCVFVIATNGTSVVGQKDDLSGKVASSMHDVAVAVSANSGTINALYGTAYKVEGTYEEYETANNIKDYASVNAMLANIGSSFFDGWNSYITFADNSISFNGQKLVKPTIGLTSAGNEVLVGGNMTFTATDATFSLKEAVAGVSINATTGELSVGSDVEPDTTITVVATSTVNGAYYEEKTVTVALESVDLTANGTYDVELGSAHGIAAIEGDVIAIKTAAGTKVTLANTNVITAAELNSAAGVNYSEGMAINFYTANSAYTLNAAFITKIIRNISDLKAAADYCFNDRDKNPVYYILANDIDGTDQGKVSAFSYNSTTSTNYTTAGFRGVFDGRGHILKNVELKDNRMFWGIGNNGVVKNFALIDPVFTSTPCILARDVVHGTISNVVVKSSAGSAFIGIACGATIENCVFIFEPNGTYLMSSKDDLSNNAASSINNVAIVVNSNSGTLKAVADNFYKPEGATYAEYEAANGIHDYASTTAMLAALASENYIAGWNSPYISYADGHLKFNGTTIV